MDPQLFALLRGFFCLIPPKNLSFPSSTSATKLNDFFLHNVLLDAHFQKYPPSQQYQRRFWKWAIEGLEDLARISLFEEALFSSMNISYSGANTPSVG